MVLNIVAIVIGYLLGSIPFAYIIARMKKGVDIRDVGGGNVGALNTYREIGPIWGISVLATDIIKGVLAVMVARWLGLSIEWICVAGFAAVIGHNWPIFIKFKGGKGAATIMGVLTLAISTSFGGSPLALVLVLALGAIMAAEIGLIAGAFIKDINTLFAIWKFGGLLLFGPAIVFMFPQIPSWVGYIFPTYYLIRPVVDLSVSGMDFGAVALYVGILGAIVVVMGLAVVNITNRLNTHALKLS